MRTGADGGLGSSASPLLMWEELAAIEGRSGGATLLSCLPPNSRKRERDRQTEETVPAIAVCVWVKERERVCVCEVKRERERGVKIEVALSRRFRRGFKCNKTKQTNPAP